MRFTERPSDTPEALRAWFYPGDSFGQEFVYPKSRAVNLAAEVQVPVLAAPLTPETKTEELAKAPVETVTPPAIETAAAPTEAKETPAKETPAVATEPVPAPVAPAPPELPKTASPLPLIALFGAISLTFALLLKRIA